MTYSAGQVVEVCSERSREWTSGFKYGSKITLNRKRDHDDVFAGEWDALDASGTKGIISEEHFRPVPEHSPVVTETVTVRRIEPGVYGPLHVGVQDNRDYPVSLSFAGKVTGKPISSGVGFNAPELRELARVALEIAEYLEHVD